MIVLIQTPAQTSLLNAASARGGISAGTKHVHWSYHSHCLLKKYFDLGEGFRPAGTLHARLLKVSAFRKVQFGHTLLTFLSVMFFLFELSANNKSQSTNAPLLRYDDHLYTDPFPVVSTLHHFSSASALGKINSLFTPSLTIPWTPLGSLLGSTVRTKCIVFVEKVFVIPLAH